MHVFAPGLGARILSVDHKDWGLKMHHSFSHRAACALLGIGAAAIFPAASQAAPQAFVGFLLPSNESPPTNSSGTGTAIVIVDPAANTLHVNVTFSGLTSGVTAAHIHCCQATPGANANIGVATTTPTFTGFPSGVTSGSYDNSFDLLQASSYNPAFISGPLVSSHTVAGAATVLINGIQNNLTYLNIHTTNNPGGEIRALLAPPKLAPLVAADAGSNAFAVAGAIDAVFASGSAPAEFVALVNPANAAVRSDTLARIGSMNESAAAQAGNEAMRQFLSLVLDPFAGTRPAQGAGLGGGIWGAVAGSHLNITGSAATGGPEQSNEGGGLAVGYDFASGPGSGLGIAFSWDHRNFSIDRSFGSGQDNGYQFAIYGRVEADALYLTAAGTYSIFDTRTMRTLSGTAVSGSYRADFTAHGAGGRMEAGLSDGLAMIHATPFAALVVDSIWMPQYGETTISGSTVLALRSAETSFDRLRSELGLGWNNIALDEGGVMWSGRAGWAHEFNSADKIPLAFAAFPSQAFTITGARLKDAAFISAGVMAPVAPGLALSGNIEGDFGATDSYGGYLQLRYSL
jgi:uncharacterized protein with beta-barrel porin domain